MNHGITTMGGEGSLINCHVATAGLGFVERLARRRDQWNASRTWQKQLFNKLTAKAFASERSVPVPQLYWSGSSAPTPPELPHSFVIKPVHGHSGRGVVPVVDGINYLTGKPFAWTDAQVAFGGKGGTLIEEYIRTSPSSSEVLEYKVFAFGEACVIRINHSYFDRKRRALKTDWHSFFTEHWELISDPISNYVPSGPNVARPEQLGSLLEYARRLARAYATFVRVDFYLSPTSVVFGEFCPFPWNGQHFTEFGDRYFGALWQQHLGDSV